MLTSICSRSGLVSGRSVSLGMNRPAVRTLLWESRLRLRTFFRLRFALIRAVRWRETMHSLAASGVRLCLEVGPKKVLSRLLLDFPALQEQLSARHAVELLAPAPVVTE